MQFNCIYVYDYIILNIIIHIYMLSIGCMFKHIQMNIETLSAFLFSEILLSSFFSNYGIGMSPDYLICPPLCYIEEFHYYSRLACH